jgi:hypothetical protein
MRFSPHCAPPDSHPKDALMTGQTFPAIGQSCKADHSDFVFRVKFDANG